MNRVVIACLLVGLAAGFAFAATTQLIDLARQAAGTSGFVIGVLATSVPVAAFGGALLCGPLAEIVGRRWALLGAACLLILGSLLSALAGTVSDLAFGRMVLGAGIGLAWVAAPMILSEASRAENRGRMVTLFFVGFGTGILAMAVLQIFADYAATWRLAFWIVCGLSVASLVAAWFSPPSPYWLFLRGDHDAGRAVLGRLGWPAGMAEPKADKIVANVRAGERLRLLSPMVRPVLFLTGALMLMDQVTGSSNVLFNSSLVDGLNVEQYQLLVAAGNLLTTLIVFALIDTVGRRILLLIGLAAAAVAMLVMAGALMYVTSPLIQGVIVAIAVCAVTLSLGPIPVLLTCELMPLHVRTMGIPIILSLNFLFDLPIVFSYQVAADSLGSAPLFLAYGIATLIGLALLWRVVPDPRRQSLEHIERYIRSGRAIRGLRAGGQADGGEEDSTAGPGRAPALGGSHAAGPATPQLGGQRP
ncbi:MFS transporter [Marinibaculum pumilum]|uniref:MFS transporter n=1 Tax=Marinibaculum pumilum TaxID=1766165 RepID=A0ABV7L8N2_9PROT